jgi:DNA-binding transcriptional regulator YiaG
MSDSTTPASPPALSEAEARALTEKIKAAIEAAWQLIVEAYHKRADQALGYQSWDNYVLGEFGSAPLRVPREDRPEMVRSLRANEMSLRAIAAVLGVSERTVRRDLDDATAANAAVTTTVIGLDGRRQPASRHQKFWRKPGSPPPAPPKPIVVVRDPAPPWRPPVQPDPSATFWVEARSLLRKAHTVAALHRRAKENPGKNLTVGVVAVRQAVEALQGILADD